MSSRLPLPVIGELLTAAPIKRAAKHWLDANFLHKVPF